MTDPNTLTHYFDLEKEVKDLRESGREWHEKWEKAQFDCEQLKTELEELRSAVDGVLDNPKKFGTKEAYEGFWGAIDKLREVRG